MKQRIALAAIIAIGSIAQPVHAQDPVKLSPKMYKVLLENDQVRILDFRIQPGEAEPQHSHPAVAVYSLSDGKAKMTAVGGKPEVIDGKTGQAFWGAATVHRYENVGKTEIHAIIVEMKPAKPASAPAKKAPTAP